jgi:methionine-S-sulfoxide reductase
MAGVVRTRVGYAGGAKADPTYHDLGDHAETIEIDYDPELLSYQDLLDVFWESHRPTGRRAWSRQYRSVIFFHDAEQRRLAEASKALREKEWGEPIHTEIVPAGAFTRAEDYHQKYSLRHDEALWKELEARFGSDRAVVDSTAAARLNGLLGGHGSRRAVLAEADALGVPASLLEKAGR